MINLRTAGPVTREDLKTLSVISGVQSVIPIPLYDTVAVANGNTLTTLQFFSHTKGASTISVTNLEQANILVSGKVEVVTGIRLSLKTPTGVQVAGTLSDMTAFAHAVGSFTFTINNVEYAQGPIDSLFGGKLYGFGTPATINQYSAAWNQAPEGFRMSPAVVIPTQVNFGLALNFAAAPNPAATMEIVAELQGQQLRLASN